MSGEMGKEHFDTVFSSERPKDGRFGILRCNIKT